MEDWKLYDVFILNGFVFIMIPTSVYLGLSPEMAMHYAGIVGVFFMSLAVLMKGKHEVDKRF